jgi:hypothetical protein
MALVSLLKGLVLVPVCLQGGAAKEEQGGRSGERGGTPGEEASAPEVVADLACGGPALVNSGRGSACSSSEPTCDVAGDPLCESPGCHLVWDDPGSFLPQVVGDWEQPACCCS